MLNLHIRFTCHDSVILLASLDFIQMENGTGEEEDVQYVQEVVTHFI